MSTASATELCLRDQGDEHTDWTAEGEDAKAGSISEVSQESSTTVGHSIPDEVPSVMPFPVFATDLQPCQGVSFAPEDEKGWRQFLDANGYAVIRGVANDKEVAKAKDLLWEWLQGQGMERGQTSTWDLFPGSWGTGIVAAGGFGQSDFLWYCRTLPKVHQAFADLWRSQDLIVSFDGGSVFRPWQRNLHWRTHGGWYHTDQGALKVGRHAVQGLVTLYDADAGTGGLCVVPGSHLRHSDVCDRYPEYSQSTRDFVPLAPNDPILSQPKVLVEAKAGDLILWDSRTVHCNTPAPCLAAAMRKPADDLLRAVAYICMVPRSTATKEVLEQRLQAWVQRQTTTHWPAQCLITCYPCAEDLRRDPNAIPEPVARLL